MRLLLFCLFLAGTALAGNEEYDRANVFTIVPQNEGQVAFLKDLYDSDQYDFWTPVSIVGKRVDVLAMELQIVELVSQLKTRSIPYSTKLEDVGQIIKEQQALNKAAQRKDGKNIDWEAYYSLDDIYAWMDGLPVSYPDLVTVTTIGTSYEGRDVKLLKISTGGTDKPAIFAESGIHAREWIAPATSTWMINELLVNQASYQSSLDAVDFYFVVVTNPDGYAFSWDDTRLWRKTRTPSDTCFGADPNRNFDFQWAEVGTSTNPCSEIYHGEFAYSEPCIQALTNEMLAVASNTRVYLGIHSYAEEYLRPWGYQPVETEDGADLASLCQRSVDAATAVHGVSYICVLGGQNYQAGGVSDDWAYEVAGIKYSYTFELRDQGFGFLLPESHIIPSGEEVFASFQVYFEHVRDNPDDVRQ